MGVVYTQGQTLGRGDLDLFLTNSAGNPANAFSITYAIYYVDPASQTEVLIGGAARVPLNPAVGEYYAALLIPTSATAGDYRIRWTFQELTSTPAQQVVQEFGVVSLLTTDIGTSGGATILNGCEATLVHRLRFMLGDNDPDRTYHFRPPENQTTVGCFNQVFGYIWTDEELLEFLQITLDKWNMQPPETEELCDLNALCQKKPSWKAAMLWGAIVNAAMMLAFRWTADEFDYSIGGISLSIEKSSKYMDLKRNAEEQWDKLTEAKSRTTKYMRGLKQPRFGIGVRSAFGPHVGRGVLSPRSFIVFCLGLGYPVWQEAIQHAQHLPTLFS
jgi:hypothetical protein